MPYSSHRNTPIENIKNVGSEISRAERSRNTRINWGTKAAVVQNAAAKPSISTTDP
jgi:hypothetical protein